MQGDSQHVTAIVEDLLRTIAVVHVPVDHCDTLDVVIRLRSLDRNGDVV